MTETVVTQDPNDPTRDMVIGIDDIDKYRWPLKCDICKNKGRKFGACIQCSKGQCKRAFHVSCAHDNGVHLFNDDGVPFALW
jgi:hypothetical protein